MIRSAVKSLGGNKVFFGSDAPGVHSGIEIQKIRSSGLSKEQQSAVLCTNFLELLQRA
jgi:predicted TIM-barrel fold metal-dependent hydrolase